MSFSRDEVQFLAAHLSEITAAAAQVKLNKTTLVSDLGVLRGHFGPHARAVSELIQARRTAASKMLLDAHPHWLFCHDSAQQATPLVVAEERMATIASVVGTGALVADVTCSVGTEGLAAQAADLRYAGSDVDAARVDMAAHNLAGSGALLYMADALAPALIPGEVGCVVADPARRAGGRRIHDPAQLIPPLPQLVDAWRGRPMAIKCAPGIDYSSWPGLVSVVSVDGGVKETCLYTAEFGVGRQAVVIRDGGVDKLSDQMDDRAGENLAGPTDRFIIDPDGAIVRAGLVRHFAVREGLWMLDERIAYLTGDQLPAGYSGFEVLETVPVKRLKAALSARDCGSVEILARGVDIDPDKLRAQLKLKGTQALSVVCTRVGCSAVAFVCGPRTWSSDAKTDPKS